MDILFGKHHKAHIWTRVSLFFTENHLLYYPLVTIGAIWLSIQITIILNGIRITLCRRRYDFAKRYGEGTWVVITGGTDGIGKAFCEKFAALGFNVAIIARNLEKLNKVESELKKINSKIQTKSVVADFKDSAKPNFFDTVYGQLESLDVSVLVNNVGASFPEFFYEFDENNLRNLTIINTLPVVILTRKFIPAMLKRQRKSAIINVSSYAGATPTPYWSAYSATKGFIDYFTQGLSYEFKGRLEIMSLLPLLVESRLSAQKRGFSGAITAKQCVEGCLRDLGRTNTTFGHWIHQFSAYVASWLPRWVITFLSTTLGAIKLKQTNKNN